jgi:hypothetical protein
VAKAGADLPRTFVASGIVRVSARLRSAAFAMPASSAGRAPAMLPEGQIGAQGE